MSLRRGDRRLLGVRRRLRGTAAISLTIIVVANCGGTAIGPSQGSTQPVATPTRSDIPAPASGEPSDGPVAPATPDGVVGVPGSHVSLVPPPGWEVASSFPGFQEAASGSSILVAELPGPFAEVTAGLTPEGLASKGITLIERSDMTLNGRQALLIEGTQTTAAGDFGRWMLVVGTSELTALVNGAWPDGDQELRGLIETALRGVVFDPEGSTGASDGLTFEIDPVAPLRRAGTVANALLLNTSGQTPSADPKEPTLVVAPSIGDVPVGDLETFARQRLGQLPEVVDLTVTSATPVTIDGREGVELTATAKRADDGRAISIYSVLLAGDQGYVLMVGKVEAKDAATLIDVFRATARTFRDRR